MRKLPLPENDDPFHIPVARSLDEIFGDVTLKTNETPLDFEEPSLFSQQHEDGAGPLFIRIHTESDSSYENVWEGKKFDILSDELELSLNNKGMVETPSIEKLVELHNRKNFAPVKNLAEYNENEGVADEEDQIVRPKVLKGKIYCHYNKQNGTATIGHRENVPQGTTKLTSFRYGKVS